MEQSLKKEKVEKVFEMWVRIYISQIIFKNSYKALRRRLPSTLKLCKGYKQVIHNGINKNGH